MLSVFSPITVNYKVRGYVVIHKPTSSLVSYANGLVAIAYETLGLLFLAAFVVLILFYLCGVHTDPQDYESGGRICRRQL